MNEDKFRPSRSTKVETQSLVKSQGKQQPERVRVFYMIDMRLFLCLSFQHWISFEPIDRHWLSTNGHLCLIYIISMNTPNLSPLVNVWLLHTILCHFRITCFSKSSTIIYRQYITQVESIFVRTTIFVDYRTMIVHRSFEMLLIMSLVWVHHLWCLLIIYFILRCSLIWWKRSTENRRSTSKSGQANLSIQIFSSLN